jgi:single-strand DNA-binding protein
MLNKVMIIGRLGRDPDIRYTQGGKAVANFSVATDSGRGDDKKTEWHKIVVWDKLADLCGKYLTKGRLVYVEGRIQTREYEKDGERRFSTEIVGYQVTFLGGGRDEEDRQPSAREDADRNSPRGNSYGNRAPGGGYGRSGGYGKQPAPDAAPYAADADIPF